MKQFIAFVIKETKHILRDKRTMLILFGMPVVMMLLFGFAITTDVKNVRTVVVTSEMSPRTQQTVERLAQSEYFIITQTVNTPREAEQLIRSQKADMALVFVKNRGMQIMVDGSDPNMAQQWTTYALQTIAADRSAPATLHVVKNVRTVVVTSEMSPRTQQVVERLAQSEYFIITQTVNTPQKAERLIRSQKADMALVFTQNRGMQIMVDGSDPNMAQQWTNYAQQTMAAANSSLFTIHSSLLYNPQMKSAYNFVPAIMGMLLMLICAMMTSISIVREKEKGTMEVLLVSPVKPLMVIIAKAVPYLVLAFGILITILLMARFVLGVPVAGSLFWILAVSTLYILLALSLGLLISNIAQTQLVALLMSAMVLLMPVVMLSGMIFPVESMPQALQWLAAIVPPRYYIEAMRKLMIMGVGIDAVAREVAVMAGMTVVLLAVALKKFNVRLE